MVGLFDSGSGGINTVRYIRENAPDVDLVYLIDRENAPYGIKSEEEITDITERNIQRLSDMRCERILIACCTASTVYGRLKEGYRKISVPIIDAISNAAKKSTRSGRIGVIATEHTVRSRAFASALSDMDVTELALSELVTMIDGGLCDETATKEDKLHIEEMLMPILTSRVDTLILGCTHFPSLKKTVGRIARRYGISHVIDSAKEGANLIVDLSRKLKL